MWMSLRSGRVREMAISTPERDRDREATSLPTELLAPLKRRARNTTEQNEHYRRRPPQPDLSADDSDTIQVESSHPGLRTKKSTATNKDLLVTLTKIIQQQNETIRNLERETKEIRKKKVRGDVQAPEPTEILPLLGGLDAWIAYVQSWRACLVLLLQPFGSNLLAHTLTPLQDGGIELLPNNYVLALDDAKYVDV